MEQHKDLILECLEYLDPSRVTYDEWMRIGAALRNEQLDVSVWDDWSAQDPERYHKGECYDKWRYLPHHHSADGKLTPNGSAVVAIAKEYGWTKKKVMTGGGTIDWDNFLIPAMGAVEAEAEASTDELDELVSDCMEASGVWRTDMKLFLEALYKPGDFINVIAYAVKSGDKYATGYGEAYTYEELMERLGDRSIHDIRDVLETGYNLDAGVWVTVNPTDGKGQKGENVRDFRYAVVECDSLPVRQQVRKYLELDLPIAALVHSGGRSAHAIVRIDAKDREQYESRVDMLYAYLIGKNIPVDRQNRNANRGTRLPGVQRGTKRQYLMAINLGPSSWREWIAEVADL